MKKNVFCLLLCLLLAASLTAGTGATMYQGGIGVTEEIVDTITWEQAAGASNTDMNYSGELDAATGRPLTEVQAEEAARGPQSGLHDYDPDRKMFTMKVGEATLYTSVPSGILLPKDSAVKIDEPQGATYILYRNGTVVSNPQLANIYDPGSYALAVTSGDSQETFEFTILGAASSTVAEYRLPEGFTLDSVMLGDRKLTLAYDDYIDFLEEGTYDIRYSNRANARSYQLKLTIDRTAPVLALEGVVDGVAKGPVSLADLEQGAWARVVHDGEESTVTYAKTVLDEMGEYTVTVYDAAGNYNSYVFAIELYFNLSALAAIGLMAAAVAGVVFYSRWVRRHTRVG